MPDWDWDEDGEYWVDGTFDWLGMVSWECNEGGVDWADGTFGWD